MKILIAAHWLRSLFLGTVILFEAGAANTAGAAAKQVLTVNGVDRTHLLHASETIHNDRKLPLLVVFHGGYQNARKIRRITGFDKPAERYGFLVAYTNAIRGHWNDGRETTADEGNDIGFVSALLEGLAAQRL